MTRDFLQGFRFSPTIRLAPDCLIYVNRDLSAPICAVCQGKKSFQNDVESVSVSLSVEGAPGSATISIPVPRHGMWSYDVGGHLVFRPMQEIEIWMRGRYLVNEEPRYYPVFWGIITNVNLDTGPDVYNINITCQDILKWWQVTTLNVNPSLIDLQLFGQRPQFMQHIFSNFNPYEIILALSVIGFGDLVGAKNLSNAEDPQFITLLNQELRANRGELIKYWQNRFGNISRRLKIFGVNGYRLNRDVKDVNVKQFAEEFWRQTAAGRSQASKLPGLLYDEDIFSAFRFDEFIGSGPALLESVTESKLDIARNAAMSIGFEFFMDTNGDIVFKPPFYNMDVRDAGPVYTIRDEDIINLSINVDADQIYTRADITGRFLQLRQDDQQAAVYGYYIDYNLARQYGIRNIEETVGYLRTSRSCYAYAVSKLSRENAKARTASVTIVGRPELRLGRPIYIESEDAFFYIMGISHSFNFGSGFTTTLDLQASRHKYHKPDEDRVFSPTTGSFDTNGDGKVKGLPNRVMKFVGPATNSSKTEKSDNSAQQAGSKAPASGEHGVTPSNAPKGNNDGKSVLTSVSELNYDPLDLVVDTQARALESAWGPLQGSWEEVEEKNVLSATPERIPISDEFGYEHVGGFPFGRGMTIGSLDSIRPKPISSQTTTLQRDKPDIIQQYGLESGQVITGMPDPNLRTQGQPETQKNPPAGGVEQGQVEQQKAQAVTFKEIVDQQTGTKQQAQSQDCNCNGSQYANELEQKALKAQGEGTKEAYQKLRNLYETGSEGGV